MNKIIEISKKPYLAIYVDNQQYIIWVGLREKNGEQVGKEMWFLPSLEMCFQEIFEWSLKRELSKKTLKDMSEMKEVILKVKKKISKIMKPLEI